MSRRSLLVMSCVLVLGHVGSVSAALVGWWPFDETSGNIARDASGQGNNGTIVGTPVWAAGKLSGALQLNGSTYVNCGNSQAFNFTDAVTLAAWIQADPAFAYPDWSGIIMRGGPNIDTFALYYNGPSKQLGFKTTGTTPNWFASGANSATAMFDNEWHHVAATYDGATKVIYLDGAPLGNAAATGKIETGSGRLLIGAGRDQTPATHLAAGKLDDAQIYDQALTAAEILRILEGLADKSIAKDPSPEDGAVDVPFDVTLGWTPGEYAATHDVYLGTTFADVNSASRAGPAGLLASQGQTAAEFEPASLEYGQTYFWRVDEVNAAPDNTVLKGRTWRFTVEPYAYPLTGVTATASSSQTGMGPQNTINGSGLNADDQHSIQPTDMWLTSGAKPAWIQFDLGQVRKLHEMWVWNSNQMIEGILGFGARSVTIEYSTDGQTWAQLTDVPEFARASGMATYAANTAVPFADVMARFVRLTIDTNWGGAAPQTGLAEVRFFYVPIQAREPRPTDGATDVGVDTDLTWRPGRGAGSHEVYLGVDKDAMALVDTTVEHRHVPASLNFGTRYYWKVNEVGDAGTHQGELWSFTTQEFAPIDDFEVYDDDNRIYDSWIDGLTTKASGSQVGYDASPFAEQTIVHGGLQSMPMKYDNSTAPFLSEAERTFDSPQNWIANGADILSLYVRGSMPAFAETASSILMNAIGADIWGTSDQFRYAYKTLNGNGAMVARVENLVNSNAWAKGGVMIRQSTEPGSTHAFMAITPGGSGGGNGASFQRRLLAGGVSTNNDSTTVVAAPYWVKVERSGNNFTGSISADGKTWTQLGTAQTITMTGPVLIGLALCSHSATVSTAAEFSNVSFTGNVTGNWQVAEIGTAQPTGNSMEPLYVTVKDTSGKSKTVMNPDAAATVRAGWVQWKIPLSEFTSAGVKMNAVKSMTIGVGNKAAPKAGGAGMLFIDDIGYGRSQQ